MAATATGKAFDRSRVMRRAALARKKRKHKKAIALYRQVLEAEPENADIHQKLAPLLAETRQGPAALVSYRKALASLLRQGFEEQAIGLVRGAAGYLPQEPALWRRVAELELERGRDADAIAALLEGRRHLRARRHRREAVQLLIQARKIDPRDFDVSYDLARLLGKTGGRPAALALLEELAARPAARHLTRVRARQLWIAPSPGRAWRLVRAWVLRR